MALYNAQPISRHDVGPLLVQPVERQSLAFLTATIVRTDALDFRIPIVTADPTAAWVNEGQDIPITDPTLTEVTVTPRKVARLVVVSRELAMDSTLDAANVVGAGLARDIAIWVDAAFFGALAPPAPAGLGAVSGISTAVGAFTTLDDGAGPSQIKAGTGSNSPLLGQDATQAGERRILGVPLLVSPAVAPGTVWAYDASRVWTVLRQDVTLDVDSSRYFEFDRVAIRGTLRVGFGFAHPQSIVKVAEFLSWPTP